jgi:hypothetical protein
MDYSVRVFTGCTWKAVKEYRVSSIPKYTSV